VETFETGDANLPHTTVYARQHNTISLCGHPECSVLDCQGRTYDGYWTCMDVNSCGNEGCVETAKYGGNDTCWDTCPKGTDGASNFCITMTCYGNNTCGLFTCGPECGVQQPG
jgi:hypothetical protein